LKSLISISITNGTYKKIHLRANPAPSTFCHSGASAASSPQ
jgi:hypothetical protein